MEDVVERVLAERRRRSGRRGLAGGLAAASVLHVAALAALLSAPPAAPPAPLEYLAVKVVPLQALGTPQPPAAAAPGSQPAPPPEPPPQREAPPAPEPPPRREPTSKPPPKAPRGPAAEAADAAAGGERPGSPLGSSAGTSPFGASRLEGIDPEFTYDYYLDRMLAAIGAQWLRPPTEGDIRAVLQFTVQKSGEITDLAVVEPSGYPAFDLAAQRAVRNASPLPRLPASYRKDALSVTLIVR